MREGLHKMAKASDNRMRKGEEEDITRAYMTLAAMILKTVNLRKEGYVERLDWVSSDLCHAICDALDADWDDYRRHTLPEEYTTGFPGVQLEFCF